MSKFSLCFANLQKESVLNHFALSLGSNISNRVCFLMFALEKLKAFGKVSAVSSIYETEPWGVSGQEAYLNLCVRLESEMNATELFEKCMQIENELGRQRTVRWGSRTIDIDLVLQKDCVTNHPELQIPHPRMHLRKFVLLPLAEICEDWVHATLKKTVKELGQTCEDPTEIEHFAAISGI